MINKLKLQKGQALMDIVIAMGIFMILIHAVFSLTAVIYETMGYSRVRLSARHIANQQMELIHNLAYDDIGTTSGIPNGIISEYQQQELNGQIYTIQTSITYVDDSFDNTAPTDILPTDYKAVRISVSWEGQFASRNNPVVVSSTISPKGVETAVGGGTLSVFVIDSMAQPIVQAEVHIVNDIVTPHIDMTLQSNSDGRVILPGAPACDTCYRINVTKNGYSSERTYDNSELAYPNKRHVTVSEGQLSEITMIIDIDADLTINSLDYQQLNYPRLPNTTFRLTSNKTLGTNIEGDPVYKYDQTITTDGNGTITLANMEWDSYMLTIPLTENKDIAGSNPEIPFLLNPAEQLSIDVLITNHTNNSLLLKIHDASSSAIASVSATLNLEPEYIATESSGMQNSPNWGQVFFDNLISDTYSYTLKHSNYQTNSNTIDVVGNNIETIILDPIE